MPSLDSLPGDQRAVLQLVLSRGRSYDQIARLLSIRPDAVRERALAALTALGPETRVSPENRELIADYLLGQLPEDGEIDRVRDLLAHSPSERAWARVVSSELASLAGTALPEIPTDTGARVAVPAAADTEAEAAAPAAERRTPEMHSDAATAAEAVRERARRRDRKGGGRGRRRDRREPPFIEDEDEEELEGPVDRPRSSRLGGVIVLALAVVAVAVALFFVLRGGNNSSPQRPAAGAGSANANSAASSTTAASSAAGSSSTTTSGSSTAAKVVSQINLRPTSSASKAIGIAEVLKEGSSNGIAVIAQNVPPNRTKAPVNAYAVWLYNSRSDATNLGFVNPGVGSNGRLSTAGPLPSNASHYKRLIVTVETTGKPKTPGRIILEGTLTGL